MATDTINVRSAPFSAQGDGQTDDRAAFAAALESAAAAKVPIVVPPGDYCLELTPGHPCLPIRGDLSIYGAGMGLSRLSFGPCPPTFLCYGFEMPANCHVSFED